MLKYMDFTCAYCKCVYYVTINVNSRKKKEEFLIQTFKFMTIYIMHVVYIYTLYYLFTKPIFLPCDIHFTLCYQYVIVREVKCGIRIKLSDKTMIVILNCFVMLFLGLTLSICFWTWYFAENCPKLYMAQSLHNKQWCIYQYCFLLWWLKCSVIPVPESIQCHYVKYYWITLLMV